MPLLHSFVHKFYGEKDDMNFMISTITAALAVGSSVFAQTADAGVTRRSPVATPIMVGQNFPDPGIIRTGDGWHAFATNTRINGKLIHVPMAYTPDFKKWTYQSGKDALPNLPSWVDASNPRVWAPEVSVLNDGSFIMYYTAAAKSHPNLRKLL